MKHYIFIFAAVITISLAGSTAQAQVTVDWNNVHQRIDGFGASSGFSGITWSQAQANMFFSTNTGVGLSFIRTQIQPGGTITTSELGIAQKAQALGAKVWSAPWSPQIPFKDSGTLNGGNYVSSNNQAYANQLAGYVATMKNAQGINTYAISVQNEPDFTTTGYASCAWTAQQFHDFVPYLYNALISSNVASTKIMLPECEHWQSDTNLYSIAMNDSNVAADVSIIADHNYDGVNFQTGATGVPATLPVYGKAMWETEVSTGDAYDGSITNAMYWAGRIHLFMTASQANAWHYWWLISINSDNEGLTDTSGNPAKRMYVLGNYSRFVRPNYVRIDATNSTDAQISAYKSTSGNFAIVAINGDNTNLNQTFTLTNCTVVGTVTPWITSATFSLSNQAPISVSNSSFTYTLPAMSVVSFVGQAVDPGIFHIVSITPTGNNMLVTWMMEPGATNALQAGAGVPKGTYSTNGFTDIFIVTNNTIVGAVTNYQDVGGATNVPARYYRARLAP
jgi:glucuronoarabinoxylan endo-1,4-beta-xylanase